MNLVLTTKELLALYSVLCNKFQDEQCDAPPAGDDYELYVLYHNIREMIREALEFKWKYTNVTSTVTIPLQTPLSTTLVGRFIKQEQEKIDELTITCKQQPENEHVLFSKSPNVLHRPQNVIIKDGDLQVNKHYKIIT